MKNILNLTVVTVFSLLFSCKKTDTPAPPVVTPPVVTPVIVPLIASVSPIPITGGSFYADIPYDIHTSTKFDLFIPTTASAINLASLVIFVHGGGFVSGSKADAYTNAYKDDIQYYMNNNIAFATVEYRFKDTFMGTEDVQVLGCMNDVKRSLQLMRFNAATYKINENKVGMYGGSAGGGCSIWLGFKNEMANLTDSDLVLRKSTRLQAIGHINSQASYSPARVLSFFASYGCTNIPNATQTTPDVDLISFMSNDDPEIFIFQPRPDINCDNILHHPIQAKALHSQAVTLGIPNVTYIPAFSIGVNPLLLENESLSEFMKRKL